MIDMALMALGIYGLTACRRMALGIHIFGLLPKDLSNGIWRYGVRLKCLWPM
jgi:hypothetical protein